MDGIALKAILWEIDNYYTFKCCFVTVILALNVSYSWRPFRLFSYNIRQVHLISNKLKYLLLSTSCIMWSTCCFKKSSGCIYVDMVVCFLVAFLRPLGIGNGNRSLWWTLKYSSAIIYPALTKQYWINKLPNNSWIALSQLHKAQTL